MNSESFHPLLEQLIHGFCEYVEEKTVRRLDALSFDPNNRAVYEVLGALVSRQSTLTRELANNPNAWNGHSAPLYLRAMADVHITLAWILMDKEARAQEYVNHALGQAKLEIEYRKSHSDAANETHQQIIDDKMAWLQSQRWEFLTEVNVGSWSGKSTRAMALEAECEDFYRLVYEPFSACVHSTWQHTEPYNTDWCNNALHIPHRVPKERFDAADPWHLVLAAKYLDKSFRKFGEHFQVKGENGSIQDFLESCLDEVNDKLRNE